MYKTHYSNQFSIIDNVDSKAFNILRDGNTVIFLRHGESKYNSSSFAKRLFYSHKNPGLSSIGIEQAIRLQELFNEINPDLIITSTLERAKQTGDVINGLAHAKTTSWDLNVEWRNSPVDVKTSEKRSLAKAISNLSISEAFKSTRGSNFTRVKWSILRLIQQWRLGYSGFNTETEEEMWERIAEFLENLDSLEKYKVVVVGHGKFLSRLLGGYHLKNCQLACMRKSQIGKLSNEFKMGAVNMEQNPHTQKKTRPHIF